MPHTPDNLPAEADIARIVGHRFPGGTYTIEHWENFLLTECTGAELLPGGMVHPVALFHVPILGSGTTIALMFALGQAESDFSIGIESYDWEMFRPLVESTPYRIDGQILSVERRCPGGAGHTTGSGSSSPSRRPTARSRRAPPSPGIMRGADCNEDRRR